MAARVIHFGLDDCCRIVVLKSAGCSVDDCAISVSQLHAALLRNPGVDAVVVSENDSVEPDEAISLTRATTTALILFQSTNPHYDVSEFDLVVPALTDPRKWVSDIAGLIASRPQCAG